MVSFSLKKIVVTLALTLSLVPSSYGLDLQDTWQEIKETGKTIGIVSGLTLGTYLVGRGSASIMYNLASSRFTQDLYLVSHRSLFADEEQFRQSIKEAILNHHAVNYSSCSVFRNYPYVKYKEDLDWYIPRLWTLQLFCIGSELRAEMNEMVNHLIQLRRLIASDYEFIKERRRFEEGRF